MGCPLNVIPVFAAALRSKAAGQNTGISEIISQIPVFRYCTRLPGGRQGAKTGMTMCSSVPPPRKLKETVRVIHKQFLWLLFSMSLQQNKVQ